MSITAGESAGAKVSTGLFDQEDGESKRKSICVNGQQDFAALRRIKFR